LPGSVTLVSPAPGATITSQTVAFSWQAVTGATSYVLSYSLSPGFPATSDSTWTLGSITRTYAILQLSPGFATVYWRVTAQNSAGQGPQSPPVSFAFDVQRLDVTSVTMLRPIG